MIINYILLGLGKWAEFMNSVDYNYNDFNGCESHSKSTYLREKKLPINISTYFIMEHKDNQSKNNKKLYYIIIVVSKRIGRCKVA